jgi:translation initiation factor IF-2
MVTTGRLERNARIRVLREGALVWDGQLGSLRRVQEDVREVAQGFECGIVLEGYNDLKEGDVLECYVTRQVERSSLASVGASS